jgi:hypothetical protein
VLGVDEGGFYLDNGVDSFLISTGRLYMFLDADAP